MNTNFDRDNALQQTYDIIIIGGGSHGAALAWEASKMGYSSILLEKNDFASGTSANSLKIIHGGIRYLQKLSFKRLFYSTKERAFLLQNFPHLVEPLQCFLPTEPKLTKRKFIVGTAFKFYDLLTYNKNFGIEAARKINNTHTVSKQQFIKLFPNIKNQSYTGGASWFDARANNSERLVFSYAMSAKQLGAQILNYCNVDKLITTNHTVTGVQTTDLISSKKYNIHAKFVIDTSGPWAFFKNQKTELKKTFEDSYAKAVNVVLDRKIVDHAIGLTIPANNHKKSRLLFYTPWRDKTVVGTWYFNHLSNSKDLETINKSELTEILNDINAQFETENISEKNITLIHKGLLPSQHSNPAKLEPELISESYILQEPELGLKNFFAIQGTKLTTARVSALNCLKLCYQITKSSIPQPSSVQNTNKYPVANYGKNFDNYHEFLSQSVIKYANIWSKDVIIRLANNFGSNIQLINHLAIKHPQLAQMVPGTNNVTRAEIKYILDAEMVYTLADVLFRRCDIGSANIPSKECIDYCVAELTNKFQWSDEQKENNIKEFLELYP